MLASYIRIYHYLGPADIVGSNGTLSACRCVNCIN